jgi:hypothetical protein
LHNRDIIMKRVKAPQAATKLLSLLNKYSRHES